jgi:hypothetical protein
VSFLRRKAVESRLLGLVMSVRKRSFLASSLSKLQRGLRSSYATAPDGASMSLQNEPNVRHPPSNQPGIVGSKRNLAVLCANLQCSKELIYLREGRLELLELESHSDNQFRADDDAFAMNFLPSKLFWLCGECAKTHVVKRWTTSGLVLALRNLSATPVWPLILPPPSTTPKGPL